MQEDTWESIAIISVLMYGAYQLLLNIQGIIYACNQCHMVKEFLLMILDWPLLMPQCLIIKKFLKTIIVTTSTTLSKVLRVDHMVLGKNYKEDRLTFSNMAPYSRKASRLDVNQV